MWSEGFLQYFLQIHVTHIMYVPHEVSFHQKFLKEKFDKSEMYYGKIAFSFKTVNGVQNTKQFGNYCHLLFKY